MVVNNKKWNINRAFRNLGYAKNQEDFDHKLEVWKEEIHGEEVRLGVGEKARRESLYKYYVKNWATVQHMWARFARRRLPIGCEHTTNRVERAFRVLKEELNQYTTGNLTTEMAIMKVIRWAESKLTEAYTTGQRKDMQIYDQDPIIQQEFRKAALDLNQTGCPAFKQSVDLMRKQEDKMIIMDSGVKDMFKDEDDSEEADYKEKIVMKEKIYATTEEKCNCTRWHQDQFPCRHILFLRKEKKLQLFKKSTFVEYFHLERIGDLDQENDNMEEENWQEQVDDPAEDDMEDEHEFFCWSRRRSTGWHVTA